ncbi:conserved exported hypothetical protein [Bacillus sp. 349Y]|nr:conserved exported hypothetical protein [Bacillus sp. 349Y]
MKKVISLFCVTFLVFTLFVPINAFAEESEIEIPLGIEVDDELVNGDEPFTIIKEEDILGTDQITTMAGSGNIHTTLKKTAGNGLEGNWVFTTTSYITSANISFYLQYKKSWVNAWKTQNTVKHSYKVPNLYTARDQKTWYPKSKGQYRACAIGTFTRIAGNVSVFSCSGTVSHNGGGVIIARFDEEDEE